MKISERVKEQRELLGLTKEELAKRCGFDNVDMISYIEDSYEDIKVSDLEKISNALNCTIAYLIGYDENPSEARRESGLFEIRDQGARIRLLREQQGLSQEDLGNMIKTSRQNIYKYEKGIIKEIPRSQLIKIANALHIPVFELEGEHDENQTEYFEFLSREMYSMRQNIIDLKKEVSYLKDGMQKVYDAKIKEAEIWLNAKE